MAQPIGVILQQWADFGVFFYVLPFLLIFAIVFAVLQKMNIFGKGEEDKRGINAIIALTIALLSLQFDTVPVFFQIIFPKVGVGLSILLAAMILTGLFVDFKGKTGAALILFGIGGIIFVVVLLQSFSDFSWWTGSFWQNNMSAIVAGIIVVIFVLIVVNSGKTTRTPFPQMVFDGNP